MIQHIQIYRMGEEEWGIDVIKEGGETSSLHNLSSIYPELLQSILSLANSLKTPQEEALERTFNKIEQIVPDEEILDFVDIIPEWEIGIEYKTKAVRKYQDKFYRCLQNHTSQLEHKPNIATSLWVAIGEDEANDEEVITWFEPTSEHYYTLGQLMRYTDGKVYKSLLAVNIYSPETYAAGWELQENLT